MHFSCCPVEHNEILNPGHFVWDLGRKKWLWDTFSLRSPILLCYYASANAPYSFIHYHRRYIIFAVSTAINPLNPELNPICYLLALLGAYHFLHVSRIRVKLLTFRRLMSYTYIYMEHPFLMFLDHTQRRSTVGRTPLDE